MRSVFILVLAGLTLTASEGFAQTRQQPIVTVSSEAQPSVARPTRKIVRMPWQIGICQ